MAPQLRLAILVVCYPAKVKKGDRNGAGELAEEGNDMAMQQCQT
jgi:hypothetical protein